MAKKADLPSTRKTDAAPPAMPRGRRAVEAFLEQARTHAPRTPGAQGRLIFALDATMSRQPTWDLACHLQASMFDAASKVGGLEVKLMYFRGHREARASRWVREAASLKELMTGIACQGGLTQMGRVLRQTEKAAREDPVAALVYVGDAMEENIDRLCDSAGKLALRNTRAFMFLEGRDPAAERAYREIARLTGGVFLPFDARAAEELRGLLAAIATYAAGGHAALEASGSRAAKRLLADLRP